jgi:hypothetical protein
MPIPRYSAALLERPSTDVEFGASQAAFELRYGLRSPAVESPAVPATPPSGGRQLVNSAAIAALTNPLCHAAPEDDLGELITDVMDLPEAQRSTVRTIVSGMLRSAVNKPSLIFALVAFVATLGLGLGTDVGRAAAHTVAETTREVGRSVVKRAADVVAPAVRRLRHPTTDAPRQNLGGGPITTPRSTSAVTKTTAAAKPTVARVAGSAHASDGAGRVLAISAGRPTHRIGDGHHRSGHAARNGEHSGGKHSTGHGASHARADRPHAAKSATHAKPATHAKHAKHATHGKGTSKKSGRHR